MAKVAGHRGGWGRCSGCLHANRSEIEQLVVQGMSLAKVAKQFDLSTSALQRHMDRHGGSLGLAKVTPALPVVQAEAGDTSGKLQRLLDAVENILASSGSATQALDAIREARALVVAQGAWQAEQERLELLRRPAATVDLLGSREFIAARTALMRALEPLEFTAARLAVAKALLELDKENDT